MDIEKTLKRLGELIIQDYTDGRITQQEQVDMLAIINHMTLKDFVRPMRKEKNEPRSENNVADTGETAGLSGSGTPDLPELPGTNSIS